MSTATPYKPAADDVKRLREATGAGMIDCRNALVYTMGDFEAARSRLQEQGQAKAAKKADRVANEGLIGSYIHAGGKIGVLVEINCETDFVARNERFSELVRDVAMHVAAMSPLYTDRESVPPAEVEAVREELLKSVPDDKRAHADRIIEGRLNKWYEEHVLLEQPFVKNDDITVGELVKGVASVLGENIKVRRFAKFALGD